MTSPQALDHRGTPSIGLDTIYEKMLEIQKAMSKIARLQDVHGKRLDDAGSGSSRVYLRFMDIERALDRVNSRLDLIEDTQNTHGAKLDAHGGRLNDILELMHKGR